MGMFTSILRIMSGIMGTEIGILMVGLDCAGKTSILYTYTGRLPDEALTAVPTVGFNVETVRRRGFYLRIWDMSRHEKLWMEMKHYFRNIPGVIFVVDASGTARIAEARISLHTLLAADELRDAVLLVFANKQDCPGAMSPGDVSEALALRDLSPRVFHVQASSAARGEGIEEGLEWMCKSLRERGL